MVTTDLLHYGVARVRGCGGLHQVVKVVVEAAVEVAFETSVDVVAGVEVAVEAAVETSSVAVNASVEVAVDAGVVAVGEVAPVQGGFPLGHQGAAPVCGGEGGPPGHHLATPLPHGLLLP